MNTGHPGHLVEPHIKAESCLSVVLYSHSAKIQSINYIKNNLTTSTATIPANLN